MLSKDMKPRGLARLSMAFVLAGGRGSRLEELTDKRAKPAVYFGGKSRIIDFALSNALNSGIRRIGVAMQFMAHSLIRHLHRGWNFLRPERNESFDVLPASQRIPGNWYAGTADAVYQNLDIIESYGPEYMVILAGDHVYKMDYELMLQQHVESEADVTIGCVEVVRSEASGFGIMDVDAGDRITRFIQKPKDPPSIPGRPNVSIASMGIYVFKTKFLFDQLRRDAAAPGSSRDFGKDIIPFIVKNGKAVAHRFTKSCVRSGAEPQIYWRDVGTVDAYWEANIDLTDIVPGARPVPPRMAHLDVCRNHPAGQVRAQRTRASRHGRQLVGVGRLHRIWCLPTPVAPVHRRARQLVFSVGRRSSPRVCANRPVVEAIQCGDRQWGANSGRSGRGSRSRTERQAVSSH